MAVKTFYFKDAVPSGATLHRSLQDGGTAPTAATTGTGWVTGTNASGQSCIQNGGSEVSRTSGQWGTTLQPSAAPSQSIGDCWRSENTLSGTFANSNWTFAFGVRSVTAAYTGRFKLAVRVWKSSNANGSSATELTGGRVASTATAANLSTTADTTVSITWSPGATATLTNEYLFVQVGVEITTAGGGTTQDIDFRVASTYAVTTPDFTTAITGTMSVSETGADTFASTGKVVVKGSLASTESNSDSFSSTGKVIVKGSLSASETGADTFAATGKLVSPIVGTLSATESGSDSFSSTGKVVVKGTLSASETGSDSFTSSGKVIVKGSLSSSETDSDTFSATGSASNTITGSVSATETGVDLLSASGQVKILGSLSASESDSDTFSSLGKVIINGALDASESGSDSFEASGVANDTFTLTGTQALLLRKIHALHGLSAPLVVSSTSRVAGDVVQTVAESGGVVTIETTGGNDTLSGSVGQLIEELAALHGITEALEVTETSRIAGGIEQSISVSGGVTTVTRQ